MANAFFRIINHANGLYCPLTIVKTISPLGRLTMTSSPSVFFINAFAIGASTIVGAAADDDVQNGFGHFPLNYPR